VFVLKPTKAFKMSDYNEVKEQTEGEKIRISLVLAKGQDESLRVPSDPIAVPSSTRKKGLSAIINHLLDRKVVSDEEETDVSDSESDDDDEDKLPAIPFDFLLNNKLLRVSIEAAARREGLSLEQAVEIKYFPARKAPEGDGESEMLPDWISAMCSTSSVLFTGNCDGSIRAFSNSEQFNQKHVVKSHSGPIKCISSCPLSDNGIESTMIATGSMDQTLLTHSFGKDSKLILHGVYSGGHSSSINSVCLLNNNGHISMASGDWDGAICFWKVPQIGENLSSEPVGKKRKGASTDRTVQDISPTYYFKAHSNNISGIAWGYQSSNTLLTSSWDHSIKSWDVENQNNILTLNGAKVATCLGRCHNSDVVATGHPDCTVRLWDMRSNSKNEGNVFDGSLRPR
jgi:ribosome biogenesis protein YTM1